MPRPLPWSQVLARVWYGVRYCRDDEGAIGPLDASRHFARCLPHLRTFRRWYGKPSHSALQEALAARPSLVRAVRRPYLNAGWSARRRLEAIDDHYRLLDGELSLLRPASATSLTVARVGGLQLRLDRPVWFEHEGELCLSLFDGETRLYSIVFSMGTGEGRRVAYVGALQGRKGDDALGVYRALTHRLHGLRPRDFLIAAFRCVCRATGVEQIRAVSDRSCVSRCRYFKLSHRVFASYDQAWIENGGRPADGGFFALDTAAHVRAASEIPARKRALYRRRYAMLDDLGAQIDAALGTLARRSGPHSAKRPNEAEPSTFHSTYSPFEA